MVSEKQSIMARQSVPDHDGVAALVITADESDQLFMTAVLEAWRWKLHFANDEFEARAVLAAESIPVVIMDGDAQAPSWRELLEQVSGSEAAKAPKVIIISRVVDERLWAEVLNLGGYDLLPKPFDATELAWVLRSALSEQNGTHGPV